MRAIRTVTVVLVALGVALLGATAGGAAEPYPPGATAVLNKSAVAPGDNVTCSAAGFQAGATVSGTLVGGNFSLETTVTADANGNVAATFAIPSDAANGPAECTLTGTDQSGEFERTVVAGLVIDNTLPITGGEFSRGGALAAGIIVLGAAMVLIARRKSGADVG